MSSQPYTPNPYNGPSILTQAPLPATLWHYTSASGCLGIIEHQQLWATDLRFLNDASEYEILHELASKRVQELLENVTSENEIGQHTLALARTVDSYKWQGPQYVVSFSEDGDVLSQWRAYCPVEGGYAIGISTEILRQIVLERAAKGWLWSLAKCSYVPASLEGAEPAALAQLAFEPYARKVADLAKRVVAELRGPQKNYFGPRNGLRDAVAELQLALRWQAAFYKHAAFAEEEECRLLVHTIPGEQPHTPLLPRRRVRGAILVPFYSIPLSTLEGVPAIVEVRVGPTTNPHLAEAGLNSLLSSIPSLRSVKVSRSPAPYRATF